MIWTLLALVVLALGALLLVVSARRIELRRMQQRLNRRELAVRAGSHQAQLQHPVVDLSRCLGCGTCVAACPEEGVLELIHGQAVVVNGSRCVGHAACERECPVGAIQVTLANLEERRDVPALTSELEAVGTPGLFLAGEVTAHALIKTAIEQGSGVAREVARRSASLSEEQREEMLDLCIVGAGPAGLACGLEAKRSGLSFVMLDQEDSVGGTVAKYPRRKLVVTQPVELPLRGKLSRTEYSKEELVGLWSDIAADEELPLHTGVVFEHVERVLEAGGASFLVHSNFEPVRARQVCLAIGRRGTPRRLGVPGEELSKVNYSLLDAQSFTGRRLLVVGGGDSAVEAALGLAEQPGNEVVLSYRRSSFHRIRTRNQARLETALAENRLRVALETTVVAIGEEQVELEYAASAQGGTRREVIDNDEVFVMVGGTAPFERLEKAGVSFDPKLRPPVQAVTEQGTGLFKALLVGFALALGTLIWALWNADYYLLAPEFRAADAKHAWLRSGRGLGLALGIAAMLLVIFNLLYLARRANKVWMRFGSLQTWMSSHMVTGILALLAAMLHAAMSPRGTVGGDALWALALLLVSGAIGRYFYAWIPRAANGQELELEQLRTRLDQYVETWDGSERRFLEQVRGELTGLVDRRQWSSSFFGRVGAMFSGQRDLRAALARLRAEGRAQGLAPERIEDAVHLSREAHSVALRAAHLEDLRAVLNTWRFVHRWVAALMVLLMILHIGWVLTYSSSLADVRIREGP
ncbi:MAG TPA: NAD(P)-binding domain-containing protein [Planctomycetota bacterium]|nr:NAD(P)-binding domain-containing protein [Planctomycetota bacterium]